LYPKSVPIYDGSNIERIIFSVELDFRFQEYRLGETIVLAKQERIKQESEAPKEEER